MDNRDKLKALGIIFREEKNMEISNDKYSIKRDSGYIFVTKLGCWTLPLQTLLGRDLVIDNLEKYIFVEEKFHVDSMYLYIKTDVVGLNCLYMINKKELEEIELLVKKFIMIDG